MRAACSQPAHDACGGGLSQHVLTGHAGHINHSLFWKNLAPAGSPASQLRDGPLKEAINRDFGSLEALQSELNAKTAAVQGSGWGWLVVHTKTGKTEVITLPNQDPVLERA